MFEQTFVQAGVIARRPWTMAASLSIQTGMVGLLVLLPLIYTDQLQFRKLAEVFTAPAPPPPAAPRYEQVQRAQTQAAVPSQMVKPTTLMEPAAMPPKAIRIIEEAPPAIASQGIGVPGGTGIPGGTGTALEGVLGSVLQASAPPPQAPPAQREAAPQTRITRVKIGGAVQDAKAIYKPLPVYPTLARQARIGGVVQLEAIVGIDGRVRELKAVSGHPLLVPAAIQAVSQWRYTPTMLNGDPVEVSTVVSVIFALGQ